MHRDSACKAFWYVAQTGHYCVYQLLGRSCWGNGTTLELGFGAKEFRERADYLGEARSGTFGFLSPSGTRALVLIPLQCLSGRRAGAYDFNDSLHGLHCKRCNIL